MSALGQKRTIHPGPKSRFVGSNICLRVRAGTLYDGADQNARCPEDNHTGNDQREFSGDDDAHNFGDNINDAHAGEPLKKKPPEPVCQGCRGPVSERVSGRFKSQG